MQRARELFAGDDLTVTARGAVVKMPGVRI
jgi:hypothetical protein